MLMRKKLRNVAQLYNPVSGSCHQNIWLFSTTIFQLQGPVSNYLQSLVVIY